VDAELISVLEALHSAFNHQRIIIASGNRCMAHNASTGGVRTSQHLNSKAADIRIDRINPAAVATKLEELYPNQYGIGRYKNWTHIDVRASKARWER